MVDMTSDAERALIRRVNKLQTEVERLWARLSLIEKGIEDVEFYLHEQANHDAIFALRDLQDRLKN